MQFDLTDLMGQLDGKSKKNYLFGCFGFLTLFMFLILLIHVWNSNGLRSIFYFF